MNDRLNKLFNPTNSDMFEEVHSYIKIYPKFTKLFEYDKPIKIKKAGFENRKKKSSNKKIKEADFFDKLQYQFDSIRRTKTRLRDVIISNDFDLFVTFTFKKDRQNVEKCKRKMFSWLKNAKTRYGKFKYVIIPEFHKDGVSLHFHALFKGFNGDLIDSGHTRPDGRIVYNLSGYTLGWSTATKIDSQGSSKVASYVAKYITKDMPIFKSKKRYWVSTGLTRPKKISNPTITVDDKKQFSQPIQKNGYQVSQTKDPLDPHIKESSNKI